MSEWEQAPKAATDKPAFFRNLGADGWECYSIQTVASAVGPRDGYEAASIPLDVRYYFKRQRDA